MRLTRDKDIPQIAYIDHLAFPSEQLAPSYRKRLENKAICYLVACHNRSITNNSPDKMTSIMSDSQNIIGFAGFWLKQNDAHMLDIAVHPEYQRTGIGEALLISLINLTIKANAEMITLEVRISNQAAQSLYQRYGFTVIGKRQGYYSNNSENALIMRAKEISSAQYQELLQRQTQLYFRRWGEERQLIM